VRRSYRLIGDCFWTAQADPPQADGRTVDDDWAVHQDSSVRREVAVAAFFHASGQHLDRHIFGGAGLIGWRTTRPLIFVLR